MLALVAVLVGMHRAAARAPFIGDDYLILDKIMRAPFHTLADRAWLLFGWYRPWSRELHYAVLHRLFGLDPWPYHAASFALWVACHAAYFALVRRWCGAATALVATAAVAASAAWGGVLVWIAGVQDLWMLTLVMFALLAFARRRDGIAAALVALALLSKETAAVAGGITLAIARCVDRDPWRVALRRVAPIAIVTLAWAAFHPVLLPRLLDPGFHAAERSLRPAPAALAARTVLAPFNAEDRPAPEHGAAAALVDAAPAVLALLAMALAGAWWARRRPSTGAPPGGRSGVIALGVAWAVLGALPLLVPSIGWYAYYGLLGTFGVWLVVASAVGPAHPALQALVAIVVLLAPLRADTPSWDWGSRAYHLRSGTFVTLLRDDLLRRHPRVPPHTRLYFSRVPRNIGFMTGDGPAFRVWYGDSTLRAGFYSEYRPRAEGTAAGPDLFFRYDSSGTWREVRRGPEDIAVARAGNDAWRQDHEELALLLGRAGDWTGAAAELEKLSAAEPEAPDYPQNLAYVRAQLGDTAGAARAAAHAAWLRTRSGPGTGDRNGR